MILLSSDQTLDQPGPSLGDVPGIRLRHHQWKHWPGSQHLRRDQDDGGQQQQQQQLLQQLQRRLAPLFLHERLTPSQKAAPGHCPDPGPAAGDGGARAPRGDGAPGDGLGAGDLGPGQTRAPGLGPGGGQTEGRRQQAERLQ